MDIVSEMYLRDGAPHATVCKVQLRDGRVGIGIRRDPYSVETQEVRDSMARQDAMANVPLPIPSPGDGAAMDAGMVEVDDDLQANLGQPARD